MDPVKYIIFLYDYENTIIKFYTISNLKKYIYKVYIINKYMFPFKKQLRNSTYYLKKANKANPHDSKLLVLSSFRSHFL